MKSALFTTCLAALSARQSLATDVEASEYTVADFNTKLFWKRPEQGYFKVNVGLPDTTAGMRVMSISDLNNDQTNDLVMVDATGESVTAYYYQDSTDMYSQSAAFSMPDGYLVDSIIPTNIALPLQNLIVTASKTDATSGELSTKMLYFKQSESSSADAAMKYKWIESTNALNDFEIYPGSQPMALDINGDQAMDLLYQTVSSGVQVALGSFSNVDSFTETDFSKYVVSPDSNSNCISPSTSDMISIPNSNSFVDLTGDCLPDLVLTKQTGTPADMKDDSKTVSTYYEIYSQVMISGKSKYCLSSQNGQLVDPKDTLGGAAGSASMPFIEIADFNRDGMLDFAFATPSGTLNVLFNKYDAQGPKAQNLCNDINQTSMLKSKDIFPKYPFTDGNGVVQEKLGKWPDKTIVYNGIAESMPRESQPGVPGRLRIADLDQDGYVDFVMTLSFKFTSDQQTFTRTVILQNVAGEDGQERSFAQVKSSDGSYLAKIIQMAGDSAELITFIDINENGKVDFIMQRVEEGKPQIVLIYNNIVSDNFFIKALSVNTALQKSQNVYNDYTLGTTYRFVITDMQDNRRVTVGSQRFQSGYMSLQLPYVLLGIGRSNNYVETFYAATGIDGKRAEHMWTPIIPNSQLIIFANTNDALNWGLELFISPTASLYLIVMVCAVCLVAIGLAIIWLHCKEKQEDAKKREQHFDFF